MKWHYVTAYITNTPQIRVLFFKLCVEEAYYRSTGQTCLKAGFLQQAQADPVNTSPGVKCFFCQLTFVFSVQMKLQDDVTSQMTEIHRLKGRTSPQVPTRGRLLGVICILKTSLVQF